MNRKFTRTSISAILASAAIPLVAYSQVYLTEDQAVESLFPGTKGFTRKTIMLTADEIRRIEDLSGEKVRNPSFQIWLDGSKNAVLIDQVLGKHDFITYAVAISASRKIKGIEILEYRETYGYEIRRKEWRAQFEGKDATAPLKVNKDVINISGATLSSVHVTAGVRRMLQTYETVRGRI